MVEGEGGGMNLFSLHTLSWIFKKRAPNASSGTSLATKENDLSAETKEHPFEGNVRIVLADS